MKVARIISFAPPPSSSSTDVRSFIALDRIVVENKFQTTLKIKTEQPDGLLYYISDESQVSVLHSLICKF